MGSRPHPASASACSRGHPRGRGEQASSRGTGRACQGPSPRARGAAAARCAPPPAARGHPRGRGEQCSCTTRRSPSAGPSPRARGAAGGGILGLAKGGAIPAGAGSSPGPTPWCCSCRGHPRGRGEQITLCYRVLGIWGPSPLARGAVRLHRRARPGRRAIPAGAGSRPTRPPPTSSRRGHPRWRGEQLPEGATGTSELGPSPLARGAVVVGAVGRLAEGAIPAGAGSRSPSPGSWRTGRGHPRWRGEQFALPGRRSLARGPSPLARGAARLGRAGQRALGAIPAGAGSRRACARSPPRGRGHPRWRGEQPLYSSTLPQPAGPSPLARGAGVGVLALFAGRGAIPAGAGSRSSAPSSPTPTRGHPRWRGEQPRSAGCLLAVMGPSPLARGAVVEMGKASATVGAIPAGAGSSGATGACTSRPGGHPRWRGEQNADYALESPPLGPSPLARGAVQLPDLLSAEPGPSPLARGAVAVTDDHVVFRGAIPAGAGSRRLSGTGRRPRGGHPRWRGEQSEPQRPRPGREGPSPLARGAALDHLPRHFEGGAIPAGAGSSGARPAAIARSRGHPRWRGEQIWNNPAAPEELGPSPLARGAESRCSKPSRSAGAIPAGAGSSRTSQRSSSSCRGHPRWRGEQSSSAVFHGRWRGPSPLARGAGRRPLSCAFTVGAIPAGAGSSLVDLRCYAPVSREFARFRDSDISDIMSLPFLGRASGPSACGRGGVPWLPGWFCIGWLAFAVVVVGCCSVVLWRCQGSVERGWMVPQRYDIGRCSRPLVRASGGFEGVGDQGVLLVGGWWQRGRE